MPRIRFLERKDINVERWDRCVRESPHSDMYALSGWLDIMAKKWAGLVQDDYEAVLPIPWNRKYLLSYIYTPRFSSPLPFCGDPATAMPLADFLARIPKKFVLWDLDISFPDPPGKMPYKFGHRTNYILSLARTYEELFGQFRPGYRNLVRQAMAGGFLAHRTDDYAGMIQRTAGKKKIQGMSPDDYHRFTRLCAWLAQKGMLEVWETLSPVGERCAGAVFAKTLDKLYYLLAWNNDEGRAAAASHLLIDRVIYAHAGSRLLLDFEGSDHPGIAHFMKGFGALPQPYIHISKRWLTGP